MSNSFGIAHAPRKHGHSVSRFGAVTRQDHWRIPVQYWKGHPQGYGRQILHVTSPIVDCQPSVLVSRASLSNLAFEYQRLSWDIDAYSFDIAYKWGFCKLTKEECFQRTFQILLVEFFRGMRELIGSKMESALQECANWKAIPPSLAYRMKEPDYAGVVKICDYYRTQLRTCGDYANSIADQIVCRTEDAAKCALIRKVGTKARWGEILEGFLEEE